MIIFINNKSTKFCQITLHIKGFIPQRKVVLFSCLMVYINVSCECLFRVISVVLGAGSRESHCFPCESRSSDSLAV